MQMSEPIWCMDTANCQDGTRMWRKVPFLQCVLVLFPNSPFLFGGGSGNETTTAQDMFGQYQASSAMLHVYNLFLKAVADSSWVTLVFNNSWLWDRIWMETSHLVLRELSVKGVITLACELENWCCACVHASVYVPINVEVAMNSSRTLSM